MQNKTILFLSIPLTALIIIASCIGLLTPGFYSAETANWRAQSMGQDLIDLFLMMPCLLITAVLAYRKNIIASKIWGGVVLYLTYTFVLYCFDVHFNKLFVVYCLCLGLSFYSLMYFILTQNLNVRTNVENKSTVRFIAAYFIIVATMFYFLWLSEIIPSIMENTIPKSVAAAGLFTNGVQVLDLAIILPAIFLTGIFLLKNKSLGFIFSPVILTFFILMDITIGVLSVIMKIKGIESDLTIAVIMGALTLFSSSLLYWYFKSVKSIL